MKKNINGGNSKVGSSTLKNYKDIAIITVVGELQSNNILK